MNDLAKAYSMNVIEPIEIERKKLIRKVYSKNIFDIIYRKKNKELLKKYDELWFNSLKKLEEFMEA